jgi:hypothetical protein
MGTLTRPRFGRPPDSYGRTSRYHDGLAHVSAASGMSVDVANERGPVVLAAAGSFATYPGVFSIDKGMQSHD